MKKKMIIYGLTFPYIDTCVEIFDKTAPHKYDIRRELSEPLLINSVFHHEYFVICDTYDRNTGGHVIGFGGINNVGFDDSIFGIVACYIDPKFQFNSNQSKNGGFGTALVNHMLERIKNLGGEVVMLTTLTPEFFARFGFVPINTVKGWSIMQSM